tara:strand:- start:62 stop:643 length:582 start_codon:yes stop_codon:yes gene_type:complete
MKQILLYIILIISIVFSKEEKPEKYHISLILHEDLINDFFSSMGSISGSGEAALVKYKWKLIEPEIDIQNDTILFISTIRLSVGDLKTHKKVEGWVSAKYDQELNKVKLKIEEAKVILDLDIFGKNVVLTELDVAHYFKKPFNLDGPKPISDFVEFDLPNGKKRQISVKADSSTMEIIDDAILVKTLLNFQKK